MKRFPLILFIGILALVVAACQSGPGAEKFGLAGTWEAKFGTENENGKTLHKKGEVTFSGNTYKFSWYKKLVNEDGSVVYDWTETARETGSISFTSEYMEWAADSYGAAQYSAGTQRWSPISMGDSASTYVVYYSLDGDKLTLKEDYNLDGDFEDVIGMPETAVYTKKK